MRLGLSGASTDSVDHCSAGPGLSPSESARARSHVSTDRVTGSPQVHDAMPLALAHPDRLPVPRPRVIGRTDPPHVIQRHATDVAEVHATESSTQPTTEPEQVDC